MTQEVANSPVSLRYARSGRTLHLAVDGGYESVCSREVRHYFGGTTATVNGPCLSG